ncbi:hypothetical protein [Streptomyces sp. NPDC058086]|uniref:hypothetical protein n=1 Tax=Streptomyces sp. NPDC058086 TaxID=3346334 RepID=UPI0036EA2A4A
MTSPAERLFRIGPQPHHASDSEREDDAVTPGLIHDEPVWKASWPFLANRYAAENARSHTRVHLTLASVCVDIEDAAVIGGVLMANAVKHSRVPVYARIPMQWNLLRTGELAIHVQDPRPDFPDFAEAVTWEPAKGVRPRGLWTARQLGAELAYAPTGAGKIVQALIKPMTA